MSIEIDLTPSLSPFVFIRSLRTPLPPSTTNPGIPTGVENMGGGGSSKFDEGGGELKSIHGKSMRGGLGLKFY